MNRAIQFVLLAVIAVVAGELAGAQDCGSQIGVTNLMKGKISRNFYLIPYAPQGFPMTIGGYDYWGHGGSLDLFGGGSAPLVIAPADGVVCYIREDLDDCGCHPAFGACGNLVMIAHAHGEYSRHLHIAQGSCSAFGIEVGDFAAAGQIVAYEGDVGRTCSSSGSPPRIGTCVTSLPPGTTNCGRHNHLNIVRVSNLDQPGIRVELMQPLTCGITGNLYAANSSYMPGPCGGVGSCQPVAQVIESFTLNGFGNSRVIQNADTITATSANISDQASAVFHAANRVRLMPGFRAGAGDAYFRAEIGPCNTTAVTPSP